MYCPFEILEAFIDIARPNTHRDLETCGILAGREINKEGDLLVDTLILPRQEGHVDHCFMTDELGLFEAQIDRKVMTLGWIHTHPSYVSFTILSNNNNNKT